MSIPFRLGSIPACAVTNKEAYQEFLNEWNTLGVGLAQFDELKDARKFYKRAKRDPEFWDKEKKERPDGFRDIRPVSLEFLIDMWRFPRSACYKIMKMKVGKIHPPAPIYKGYGVFKISSTRPAVKSQYKNRKESYYKQIEARKKRIGLSEWIEDLKRQANIEVYEDVLAKIKGTEPKAAEEAEEKDISEKGE